MSNISTNIPLVEALPVIQITQDLDSVSVNSSGTLSNDSGSKVSDIDRDIDHDLEEGEFFENKFFDEKISRDVVVSHYHRTDHYSREDNPYINLLNKNSNLHVLKEVSVINAASKGPLYLFLMCFRKSFISKMMLTATNRNLSLEGLKRCTISELKAYIGIEVLVSALGVCRIKNMWNNCIFKGNLGIKCTLPRDRYFEILTHLGLHNYDTDSVVCKDDDPLWSVRTLLGNFLSHAANIAVPVGPMTLDEATLPTKARTHAVSYIPMKPNKYGIRFYMIVGSKYQYIYYV